MKERRADYDILRLIAIVFVVYNHTDRRGYALFLTDGCHGINYMLSLVMASVCNIAVPLFFMVSGGLLLSRNESLSHVMKKRTARILAVLLLFSGILYGFWYIWGNLSTPGLSDFLTRLWSQGVSIPYWYLYAYLSLMLLLPFLRPMVQHMSDALFPYLFILHVILQGVLPAIGLVFNLGMLHSNLVVATAEPTVFYFIFGYYLACRAPWDHIKGQHLALLWIAAAAALVLMSLLLRMDVAKNGDITVDAQMFFTVFPALAVYASVHQYCLKHPLPDKPRRLLCSLGPCVFGVYLLEGILRHYLSPVYTLLQPRLHVLPACGIWVLSVVLSGLAITALLKRLPLFRRLL